MDKDILICSIAKVIHYHFKCHSVVGVRQELHAVEWDKLEVVVRLESIDERGNWHCFLLVIHQPACDIGIGRVRYGIEKVLGVIRTSVQHIPCCHIPRPCYPE